MHVILYAYTTSVCHQPSRLSFALILKYITFTHANLKRKEKVKKRTNNPLCMPLFSSRQVRIHPCILLLYTIISCFFLLTFSSSSSSTFSFSSCSSKYFACCCCFILYSPFNLFFFFLFSFACLCAFFFSFLLLSFFLYFNVIAQKSCIHAITKTIYVTHWENEREEAEYATNLYVYYVCTSVGTSILYIHTYI